MADDLGAWAVAWEAAAFGSHGFYGRALAEEHFATDVTDGDAVARRLVDLISPELERLVNRHGSAMVTDAGAGSGLLLQQLAALLPASLAGRVTLRAIDVRSRPVHLPHEIAWVQADVRDVALRVDAGRRRT